MGGPLYKSSWRTWRTRCCSTPLALRTSYFTGGMWTTSYIYIWQGSDDTSNQFLQTPNDLHPSVQFTSEIGHGRLNYLHLTTRSTITPTELVSDVSIHRKNTYRGPTPPLVQTKRGQSVPVDCRGLGLLPHRI